METTKEKILEAAKECPEAKKVLEKLFPEAFEDEKYIDVRGKRGSCEIIFKEGDVIIEIANSAAPKNLRGKCFYLISSVNWEIIEHLGQKILLPTKKS